MDDRYIFHWKELPFDGAYYLAEELYSARRQKKLSLEEVSRATGIPPVRIDAQEVMSADIDFHIIARLLDFYRIKLGLSKGFFPACRKTIKKNISAIKAGAPNTAVSSRPEPHRLPAGSENPFINSINSGKD